MRQNIKEQLKGWPGFALFCVLLLFALLWAGRSLEETADGRTQFTMVNDEYSRIVEPNNTALGLTQPFDWPGGETLYGLRLNVATFNRVCRGTARVQLYDAAGQRAASAACDMTQLLDNTFYCFVFDAPYTPHDDSTLTFVFSYEPETPEDKLGLWASEGAALEPLHQTDGEAEDATLAVQVLTGYSGTVIHDGYRRLLLPVLVLLTAGAALIWKKHLSSGFLLCACTLGLCFALVIPPLCGPDEYTHAAGAYALANTLSGEEAYTQEGLLRMRACDAPFMTDETGPSGALVYADVFRALGETGNDPALIAEAKVRAPGSVVQTLYLPTALGICAARTLGLSFYGMLLMGRLSGLLIYLILGTFALRRMPFARPMLFLVMLLPSTMQLAACISADTLILGLSFAFTALCLQGAYPQNKITVAESIELTVLAAMLGPGKAVYILLTGLVFLIPLGNYRNDRQGKITRLMVIAAAVSGWLVYNLEYVRYVLRDVNELAVGGCVLMLAAAIALLPRVWGWWRHLEKKRRCQTLAAGSALLVVLAAAALKLLHLGADLTPEQLLEGMQPNGDSIYTYSVGYALRHWTTVCRLLAATILTQGASILQQILGACPGEPIVHQLSVSWLIPIGLLMLLTASALREQEEKPRFKTGGKVCLSLICLGIVGLITMACLTWTPVNYECIFGWQGRYLLPILPLLLLLWGENNTLRLAKPRPALLCLGSVLLTLSSLLQTFSLFAAL